MAWVLTNKMHTFSEFHGIVLFVILCYLTVVLGDKEGGKTLDDTT